MKCQACSEDIDFNYVEEVNIELRQRQLCHTDNFWFEKVRLDHGPWKKSHVIVNGIHYHIGPADDDNPWRGHGGAEFNILFNDGRTERTTNLWCQGDIPERWRHILPDNAIFLKVGEPG